MIELKLSGQSSSITFQDLEVPEHVTWGGEQLISVHQLIGGTRIIDALGPSDAPLAWAGVFLTSSAVDRARFCDTLRRTGEECTVTWGEFTYTGVVSNFSADYTRGGLYVPYRITLTVAEDKTAYVLSAPLPSAQAQTAADLYRVNTLQGCIGDSTLTGLTATVNTAVNAVVAAIQPIAKGLTDAVASTSSSASCAIQVLNNAVATVQAALIPIAQAQAQAQVLITSAEQTITSISTVGGLLPGNPVAQITGKYIQQVNAAIQLPPLYEYASIMGRMSNNLNVMAANGPTAKTITVGGGSLQQVAAQQYGDATLWPVIAQANNISDPQLTGINTLIIPPRP